MKKDTRKVMNVMKQSLVDFFYVYFDEKTSKKVKNHPDMAIPLIKEEISLGISSRSRLLAYAKALNTAFELETLRMVVKNDSQTRVRARPAEVSATSLVS